MQLIKLFSDYKLIAGIGLCVLTCNAVAQRYPATDTDLRAAYCLPQAKEIAELQREGVSEIDEKKLSKEMLDFLRTEREKSFTNLNRLQSYLLPRLKYLDSSALTLAMGRYKTDKGNFEQCMAKKQCKSFFQTPDVLNKCLDDCNIESAGARDRLWACLELNWLPF